MNFKQLGLAGIAMAFCAPPAASHHSFAMFNASKLVTLDGVVKEFQWTNPHAWILLMVAEGDTPPVQWAIEMNGPTGLARTGWTPRTLRPGMKVKIVVHPLHDGQSGGQFLAVTLPDGTTIGNPEGRAQPPVGGNLP